MSIKFLVLGGVILGFWRGGVECRFYFYGRGDFLNANRGDFRFAGSPVFITFKRFARIASNLRFAIFSRKRHLQFGNLAKGRPRVWERGAPHPQGNKRPPI